MRIAASLLSLLLLCVGSPLRAAPEADTDIERILSAPFFSDLTASPNGRRLAWFANERGMRNLWVAEAPDFRPRRLTQFTADDGQALSELLWSPDSETILFVRGEGSNQAGETPNPTNDPAGTAQVLWCVTLNGGLPRVLGQGTQADVSGGGTVAFVSDGQIWEVPLSGAAPARPMFRARGRNSSPAWSPDGLSLAFVSDRDDHSFIGLYRTSADSLQYVDPTVDRDSAPRWSPDGRQIAFVRQPGRGGDPPPPAPERPPVPWAIRVAALEDMKSRQVWTSAATVEGSLPRMAGDDILRWAGGGRLVFASEQDGWLHLYAVPAAGGSPRLLTPGDCEVEGVTYGSGRNEIIYTCNCGDIDRRQIWSVNVAGGEARAVTAGATIDWNPASLADGTVAFLRADARYPGMPHLLKPSSRDARALAPELRPKEFPSASLVEPQAVLFRAADGLEIHGQLFLPKRSGTARLPAVVFMHGGPVRQMLLGWHNRYYYHNAYGMNQYLASRGYAVLSVNYRAGIGYGRAFREAPGLGARGASEYQDIVAAGRYLQSRPDIDPARIGLWGGSYGGYLTALALARNSDMFAAGVDLHGVHDWSTRRFRSWAGSESQETLRKARESSPVASVDTWKSPVLLVHGDDDRNVDFSQTVDLAQRLRARNIEFEQIVFPDEVHDFLLHRHWLEVYRAAADFFDRHLAK